MRPVPILLVACGGAVGAVARYLVGMAVATRLGDGWPWGTFAINLSGCFFISFFLTLTSGRVVIDEAWRYLFPIGFVGAYTTFSSFEWETYRLVGLGAWGRALVYVVASTTLGYLSVWLAAALARRW